MKTITNYITERIRVDNINERIRIDNIKSVKFPIDGTIDEIIKFLEGHGFKEIDDIKGRTATDFFNSKHDRCYWLRDKKWIYFGDTNNTITKDNPIFVVFLYGDGSKNFKNEYGNDRFEILTKDEFLQKLNKVFDF